MKSIPLFILLPILSYAQCPNDLCEYAIDIEYNQWYDGCNYDCTRTPDDINVDVGFNPNYPCGYVNDNSWYHFTLEESAIICIWVTGEMINDLPEGNFGDPEGIEFRLWEGLSCSEIEVIWGTSCYWLLNDIEYIGTGEYDPSRQEWNITYVLPPGNYYIDLDGFGWSEGCYELTVCKQEPLFLSVPSYTNNLSKVLWNYDLIGRKIK